MNANQPHQPSHPRAGALTLAGLLAATLLTACDPLQGPPPPSDKAATEAYVQKRAEARWAALGADQWDQAYAFNTPGSRSLMSLEQFKARYGKRAWSDPRIERTECQQDRCTVTLSVHFLPPQGGGGSGAKPATSGKAPTDQTSAYRAGITEEWILTQGEWWRVERQ